MRTCSDEPITDAELHAMQQRIDATGKAPWRGYIAGRGDSFDSVITVGGTEEDEPDTCVYRGRAVAIDAEFIFIAAAHQDVPRLMAEAKRLRRELDRARKKTTATATTIAH
jgi:hypothetical protein